MINLIIWGTGSFYSRYLASILQYERMLGNVNIVCFTESNISKNKKDGYDVLEKEEALRQTYDYIVVASASFEKQIKHHLLEDLGVRPDKIILGRVFKLPYFNLSRYIKVKAENVTIVAESCYGATFCHALGLEFKTPFVNLRISSKDYLKLLNDPLKYLNGKAEISEERVKAMDDRISWGIINEPLICIEKDVRLHCVHIGSAEEALYEWKKKSS